MSNLPQEQCEVYARTTRLERLERYIRQLADHYNDIAADYDKEKFLTVDELTIIIRGSDDENLH